MASDIERLGPTAAIIAQTLARHRTTVTKLPRAIADFETALGALVELEQRERALRAGPD